MQDKSFKDHGVWHLLDQASTHLNSYSIEHQSSESFNEVEERVEYLRWVLEQSDPTLISHHDMDFIQNPLQQIVNHLGQNQSRPTRLGQTDQWFVQIFDRFPYARVRKIFRSERTEILNSFENKILEMRAEVEELSTELLRYYSEEKARLSDVSVNIRNAEKSVANVEARAGSELDNWESRFSREINEKLSQLTSDFNDAQSERAEEFQTSLDQISAKLRELETERSSASAQMAAKLAEIESESRKDQKDILDSGNKFLSKIEEVYNVSGQTALAGDFDKGAQQERTTANWFALLAAIFFIVTPLFFVYQWFHTELDIGSPASLALKLSGALAFLVPAIFFGNTSRRHHRVATALRSLGIRVATFDAYLVHFEENDRNRIKEEMAEVFFAAQISPDRLRANNAKDLEKAADLTDRLLEQAKTAIQGLRRGD